MSRTRLFTGSALFISQNCQRFLSHLLTLFLTLLTLTRLCSQSLELVEQGNEFFNKKEYNKALSSYFRAIHKGGSNAEVNFKIGYTYLFTENKEYASSFLENAYEQNPFIDPDILLYLAKSYQAGGKYANAKITYERHKKMISKKKWPEIDRFIRECIVSHALLSNPVDVIITNEGTKINSPYNEFAPALNSSGTILYFTSNRPKDTLDLLMKRNREDTYFCQLNENGDWGDAKAIEELNTEKHEAIASLSFDDKTLLLYCDENKGDIYISKQMDKGVWQKPLPLNKNINTPYRETGAVLSPDGKRLFFASNRPGGKGGLDIYFSDADAGGNWGIAINAGHLINTDGDEDSPFIHADGKTLYFSSNGHSGMGSSDIYFSTLNNNEFTKPLNIGFPINSIEYDGFFTINAARSIAYFVSKRKYGSGEYDILKATYRSSFNSTPPVATLTAEPKINNKKGSYRIKGIVQDKTSKQNLGATISLVSRKDLNEVITVQTEEQSGKYLLTIAKPGAYTLTAQKEGYLYQTVNINIPENQPDSNQQIDFYLKQLTVGSIHILKNLFFDTGSADLKTSSIAELEKIRKLLLENTDMVVQINGHTDNTGDAATNKALSYKRALAVVNFLALNGINYSRLSAKGFGSEKPIVSNDDEEGGRSINRRTEIEIISNKYSPDEPKY